ncbi:CesT family type III secretion system chaperone [Pseudomonas yamanorum]|uniref:CesT family type III secretion system chaperone n=1 Tax=Pseudomonas yamanorum TaxID=515393 RepID=UPI0015A283CE|nr:CesT family type III secretion system chaperone [Pseudomonas yamanorum]NWD25691.1 CesT family type III secretion system chaperone [Pseudomonas yamanorum]
MATAAYSKLIDQLCELTMISNPSAFYEQANLSVKDVDFTLRHNSGVGEGDVFIYCSYGALPKTNRELVLERLLEANLLLFSGPLSPSLSYNADTEHVILCGHAMIENLTAERLLGLMGGIADMALVWREGYFIENDQATRSTNAKPQQATNVSKSGLGVNAALLR